MTTLRPKDIDISKIKFGDVKKLDSGAKVCYVQHNNERLTVQLPVMNLPYGLSSFTNDDTKDTKYDLTVSFGGMDENEKIKTFYDKMKEIEERVISQGVEKKANWFPSMKGDSKGDPRIIVENFFTEIVKPYKEKNPKTQEYVLSDKYPPSMKIKLPFNKKTDSFEITCHDMDTSEEVEFNKIKNSLKGAKAQLVIQLTGIWIAAGKFGCSWKVIMGRFRLTQRNKVNYLPDSDVEEKEDEKEEEDKDSTLEDDANTATKDVKQSKKDSEDEEEDDEEDEQIGIVDSDDDEDIPPPVTKKGPAKSGSKKK